MSNTANATVKTVGAGVPWFSLLGVFFILMKLNVFNYATGIMAWSWWWVLAPFWMPFAIGFGIVAIILIIGLICVGIAALCS